MMRWLRWVGVGLFLAANVHAASIRAYLIRASNDQQVTNAPPADLVLLLKKQFGYQHYYLLGMPQETQVGNTSQRLNLGEGFVLFVTPKGEKQGRQELEVEWTSGRASLMKSTVRIKQNKYLLVKGPGVGSDWIVLAVTGVE